MIITEKQLLCLIDILKDSLIFNMKINSQFSIPLEQRIKLMQIILQQQSNKLVEIND